MVISRCRSVLLNLLNAELVSIVSILFVLDHFVCECNQLVEEVQDGVLHLALTVHSIECHQALNKVCFTESLKKHRAQFRNEVLNSLVDIFKLITYLSTSKLLFN